MANTKPYTPFLESLEDDDFLGKQKRSPKSRGGMEKTKRTPKEKEATKRYAPSLEDADDDLWWKKKLLSKTRLGMEKPYDPDWWRPKRTPEEIAAAKQRKRDKSRERARRIYLVGEPGEVDLSGPEGTDNDVLNDPSMSVEISEADALHNSALEEFRHLVQNTTPEMLEQIALQNRAVVDGADRFMKNVERAHSSGEAGRTKSGKIVVDAAIKIVADAIDDWLRNAEQGGVIYGSVAPLIAPIHSRVLAFIALRTLVDECVSRHRNVSGRDRKVSALQSEIGRTVHLELVGNILTSRRPGDTIRMIARSKIRYTQERKQRFLKSGFSAIARLKGAEIPSWTEEEIQYVGSLLLNLVLDKCPEMFEMRLSGSAKVKHVYNVVYATADLLDWIDKSDQARSLLAPLKPPMAIPPVPWTGHTGGGYLRITPTHKETILLNRFRNAEHTKRVKDAVMPDVYRAVNHLQDTGYRVNEPVMLVFEEMMRRGDTRAGIPDQTGKLPDILSIRAPEGTSKEDLKIHRRNQAEARSMYLREKAGTMHYRFLLEDCKDILGRKNQLAYYPVYADFRGRLYVHPTSPSPQGRDLHKGLLMFAKGDPIGSEGAYWLATHVANCAGHDKLSMEDRYSWTLDNDAAIRCIAESPLEHTDWMDSPTPWTYLAACIEWSNYRQVGDSYECALPRAFDGSCSGLQHFSAMTRDLWGGSAVNLVPKEIPDDIYTRVLEKVKAAIEWDIEKGTEDTIKPTSLGLEYQVVVGTKRSAQEWKDFGIKRADVKRPVMTLSYGATKQGFKEQIYWDTLHPAIEAKDPRVPAIWIEKKGRATAATQYLAEKIWEACQDVVVKGLEVMAWLGKVSSAITSAGHVAFGWTTPTGFPTYQKLDMGDYETVRSISYGTRVTVYRSKDVDKPDKRAHRNSISPNFVHSLDAAHLVRTVVAAANEGIDQMCVIHDSFACTPGNAGRLNRIVREEFVRMYEEHDVLAEFKASILSQFPGIVLPDPPEKGTLDLSGVLNSQYAFS